MITSPGYGCKVLWWLCLSVCLSVHLPVCPLAYLENRVAKLHQIFVHGRGSVLLWQRCDTLYISDFTDDVMFSNHMGTNGRTGTALCGFPCSGHSDSVIAGRVQAAAAHWLAGLAAGLRSGGCSRLLPGTVVHVSPCALWFAWLYTVLTDAAYGVQSTKPQYHSRQSDKVPTSYIGDLGKHCNLPQRGPGQSPGKFEIWCNLIPQKSLQKYEWLHGDPARVTQFPRFSTYVIMIHDPPTSDRWTDGQTDRRYAIARLHFAL